MRAEFYLFSPAPALMQIPFQLMLYAGNSLPFFSEWRKLIFSFGFPHLLRIVFYVVRLIFLESSVSTIVRIEIYWLSRNNEYTIYIKSIEKK